MAAPQVYYNQLYVNVDKARAEKKDTRYRKELQEARRKEGREEEEEEKRRRGEEEKDGSKD